MIDKVISGWSINKEISLEGIIALLVALGAILSGYNAMDRRVILVEKEVETVQSQMTAADTRIERENTQLRDEIKADLRDIKLKLEQINDRTLRGSR